VEEHLGITIDQVDCEMTIPVNEFDGKVTYGQKRKAAGNHCYYLTSAWFS